MATGFFSENDKLLLELYSALKGKTQEISQVRLGEYAKKKNVELKTVKKMDLGYDHWIILMNMKCPGIKINFSCHFSTKSSRDLAQGVLGAGPLPPQLCHEFISEYCNITMGGIKNALSTVIPREFKKPSAVEIFLPEEIPSYDESLLGASYDVRNSYWTLTWPGGELICTVFITLREREIFSAYQGGVRQLIEGISRYNLQDHSGIELYFMQ